MIVFAKSVPQRQLKIHWSYLDGTTHSSRKVSKDNHPIHHPSHKPNPNKQVHRKISNINIHKYFGFRTLKDPKPFQQVSLNNITFTNAGEIPLEHGNFTTILRNRHNTNAVQRPKHFLMSPTWTSPTVIPSLQGVSNSL